MRTQTRKVIKFCPSRFESGVFPTCVQRVGIGIKLFLDLPMISNTRERK